MSKTTITAVHDKDLLELIDKFGLTEKLNNGLLKCKFTETIITFDNLYSIFPESNNIRIVCDQPEAIKLFAEYINEHKL
jgi:hypothetical protein